MTGALLLAASGAVGLAATPAVGRLAHTLQHDHTHWPATRWAALGAGCALTGLAVAVLSPAAVTIAFAAMLALGLAASAVDATEHRLPDTLTYPILIGGLAVLTLTTAATGHGSPPRALAGAAIYGSWMLIGALAAADGYGLGDVKLAAGIGAWLAWQSWATLAVGLLAGQTITAAALLTAHIRRKPETALGPALITGAIVAIL